MSVRRESMCLMVLVWACSETSRLFFVTWLSRSLWILIVCCNHRQIGACCACSKCGTFLFAPLMVIVLWPQYREKIAQHMLRAIAVLHFPIYALKSCPAPAALAAGAGHYFSLTAYNLTFKPPYRGKGLKKDIS